MCFEVIPTESLEEWTAAIELAFWHICAVVLGFLIYKSQVLGRQRGSPRVDGQR